MIDAVTDRVLKIQALAQGGYEHLVRNALDKGSTLDEFGMDLLTEMNREAITIDTDRALPAGSILVRAYSDSVTAHGGNTGNGTLTVDRFGEDVVEGIYVARCTEVRTDRGIFELRAPNGGVIGEANVGTQFLSSQLVLSIADGSTDFVSGDSFNIEIVGGSYSGYDFEAAELDENDIQIASAVLAVEVSPGPPFSTQQQFAVVSAPAILPKGYIQLGPTPWGPSNHPELLTKAMTVSIAQLARRGIVERQ